MLPPLDNFVKNLTIFEVSSIVLVGSRLVDNRGERCTDQDLAPETPGPISSFMVRHFRHFNSATLIKAAKAYRSFTANGGKMMVAVAGAMSTAEIGLSLAEMIRRGHVSAISCTGANLEEDLFNLVAKRDYRSLPNYRDLTPQDEEELLRAGLNRVTDTCIPESRAIRLIESVLLPKWLEAEKLGKSLFPHEFLYELLSDKDFLGLCQTDPSDSWVLAACERELPIFVPGWEDSTLGNIYAGHCMKKTIHNVGTVRGGTEYMIRLAQWYTDESRQGPIGLLQIGGGIAGDFCICVVPMLHQDMEVQDIQCWQYFCQVSDANESYGSYSGASPNEKISWGKLDIDTPRFVIQSDATIVIPLLFAHVLGW